ncbi:flagellar hook-associated protein FlgL [Pontiella agarivorans]|uniref:Flagellar hook-associated protein FlgL n=1 Tax=Pontiella agarivorans TaxID=3038953 RepID=A0ABU5MT35_9BACT|nr:flagellar hook-associated protein FlgL [Pontiella agarivorans]MDZ8117241.1 flagellar hook-associated protein FlgL [Pontiella agarivorans]
MRISNQMSNQMLSNNIMDNQAAVYRKEQQIASGNRMEKASDDPVAWARLSQLLDQQEGLVQYERNAQLVESRLLSADQMLDSIGSLLQNASELAVQASDGTLNEADRQVLGAQVDALLEQLVTRANTPSDGGGYLFGGIQSASEPFAVTRNADGYIDSVVYEGGSVSAMVEVAAGDALPNQLVGGGADNGVLISSSTDAFAPLIEMRDRLLAGENLAETTLQTQVDGAAEKVIVSRASVGAYIEHLSFVNEIRGNQDVSLKEDISALEGIDIAQAVSELTEKQTAYQAALAMATKTVNMSLLNYI